MTDGVAANWDGLSKESLVRKTALGTPVSRAASQSAAYAFRDSRLPGAAKHTDASSVIVLLASARAKIDMAVALGSVKERFYARSAVSPHELVEHHRSRDAFIVDFAWRAEALRNSVIAGVNHLRHARVAVSCMMEFPYASH